MKFKKSMTNSILVEEIDNLPGIAIHHPQFSHPPWSRCGKDDDFIQLAHLLQEFEHIGAEAQVQRQIHLFSRVLVNRRDLR